MSNTGFCLKFYLYWCVNKDACTKRSMHLHIQIKGQKSDPLFPPTDQAQLLLNVPLQPFKLTRRPQCCNK